MSDADRNKRAAGNRRPNGRAERARAKSFSGVPGPGVVVLPDDDPRLVAAAAEATRRVGEFVAAFRARRPGDAFAVKVPFADDYGREFLWVGVAAITDAHFVGRVDNRPAFVRAVAYRQTVRVPRAGLADWVYLRGATVVGGFSFQAVAGRLPKTGEAA